MLKKMRFIFISSLLSLVNIAVNAAILTVESLDDALGTVATLRQTILDASSGDTIEFDVSGTIFLDQTLGTLLVDKQLIIDGGNKIVIDGQNQINIGFRIANTGTVDASGSVIQNIVIQNFDGHEVVLGTGTQSEELPAYGILIEDGAEDCSVLNTTILNINSGQEEDASGIISREDMQEISGNIISNISSESDLVGNSGNVSGVLLSNGVLTGDCVNNSIANISTGDAANVGSPSGILLDGLNGNCINNTVENLTIGLGNASLATTGIFLGNISLGTAGGSASSVIACNTISNISSAGILVAGIVLATGDDLIIQNNVINSIENNSGPTHGLLLGLLGAITNSLVSFNTISDITGSNNNGYGVSIESPGSDFDSRGNDLLNNSIFNINGSAINIVSNGAPVDGRVILSSVRCADGCKLIVTGTLISAIDAPQYKLQFFVSDNNNPSQTQAFIAERILDASSDLSFKLRLTGLPEVVTFGKYVTATVTALPEGTEENNNTSEVSNALPACEPFGNFCPCAEVVEPEVPLCPAISA